jgi:hypothetical protein
MLPAMRIAGQTVGLRIRSEALLDHDPEQFVSDGWVTLVRVSARNGPAA